MALHPCPQCARHVLHSETRCPFCGLGLGAMSAEAPMVPRVARAALVLGAALALGACDESTQRNPTNNPPQQPNINDPNAVAPVYGGPPSPEGTPTPPQPTVADSGAAASEPVAPVAIYGAPPPPSAQNNEPPRRPPTPMSTRYGAPPAFDQEA